MRRLFSRILGRTPAPEPTQASGLPHFAPLIEADEALWTEATGSADRIPVLVATSTGGHHAVIPVEGMLSAALTLRGAEPHVLLCDGALPACQECDIFRYPDVVGFLETGPQADRCARCFGGAAEMYAELGVQVHGYSEYITGEDRRAARDLAASADLSAVQSMRVNGVSIGEHAYAGALRYYARGELASEPLGEQLLRRYIEAAYLTACAASGVQQRVQPKKAVFHHGIYVPQGLVGDVMRREGVGVVNWAVAYRKQCFIFSHDDSYHRTMMSEDTSLWEDMRFGECQEQQILEYLRARWYGTSDWILVQTDGETSAERIAHELGLDLSIPTVVLLTNVIWDAQLFYESNAFPDMLDWLMETVRYFGGRPDMQLVIRIHPAETSGTLVTRQPVSDEIRAHFPELPPNVRVIGPDQKISTYALADACDAAIIYGTKTGVELAAMGIPVIVAGEAWIRDKGITLDARTADEYFSILDTLPMGERMDEHRMERARRYAYHFFMRKMIPLEFMQPTAGWPPFEIAIDRIGGLTEGTSRGLDVICDGILKGTPFVYPAERIESCE